MSSAINDKPDEATIHPFEGLKRGPVGADWDPDTILYGPDWRSRSGHTDGWCWATDGSTLCGFKDGGEYADEADESDVAAKVLGYLTDDLPAPLWAVEPADLGKIGGIGRLRDWGLFDLDRVHDAAVWVCGEDMRRVIVAVTPGENLMLRIVAPTGRVAVVMGMRHVDGWFPTIDLPAGDAVQEALDNGYAETPPKSDQNGRSATP